ncbi:oligosaccharide flippase family protein [bacterium]|nr:oligosaccharide flippase family protein [bacterium]
MKEQLKQLARHTVIYGFGRILNRFLSFLLLPVFTAYLTPSDYGIISILGLIAFVLTPVFTLGLNASMGVSYFEGDNTSRKEATVWTTFVLLVLSAVIMVILGTLFSCQISLLALRNDVYSNLIVIFLIATAISIVQTPFQLYLQFEKQAKLFVVLTFLSALFVIGATFWMVVVLKKGVLGYVQGYLIGQIGSFSLILLFVTTKIKLRFNPLITKELLRLGLPLVPSFAFFFILRDANKYLLQWFDGLDCLGVYTIGFNIGMIMTVFVNGFISAWYPYFMSFMEKKEEASRLFGRILTYYVFGFGTLCIMFFIAAKPVVYIMTQPSFHNAYKVVGFSATTQFLIGVFSILLPGMYFAKQIKYVSIIQGIAAVITILLNLLFIPLYGMMGAAIALMLGFLSMVLLTQLWNTMKKSEYIQVSHEWNRIARFSLIFLAYMIIMPLERELPLSMEIGISIISTILLFVLIYYSLNYNERQTLWKIKNKVLPIINRVHLS